MKRNKRVKRRRFFLVLIILIAVGIGIVAQKNWDNVKAKLIDSKQNTGSTTNSSSPLVKSGQTTNQSQNISKTSGSSEDKIKQNILLVNRTHKLSEDYVPENLRVPNVKFIHYADPNVKKMCSEAATALENLFAGAKKDKFTLLAVSGYRDYDYQKDLYKKQVNNEGEEKANKYLAVPGSSEHQSGLAMDLLSTEYENLDDGFANTKTYIWLEENCAQYGFIIRYPKDKEDITKYSFEPWHVRYVGVTAATEIMKNNLTLEEYLNKLN